MLYVLVFEVNRLRHTFFVRRSCRYKHAHFNLVGIVVAGSSILRVKISLKVLIGPQNPGLSGLHVGLETWNELLLITGRKVYFYHQCNNRAVEG